MSIEAINPATGEQIQVYTEMSADDVERALSDADQAATSWRQIDFGGRASVMKTAAQALRKSKDAFARLMAQEMGKPLVQGEAEVEKCAWGCDFFAEHAEGWLGRKHVQTEANESFITFQPLGVVLAVMPWNFPFWQVFRCAAPALMAGNALLLKHASNVTGCALAIEKIFREAGFSKGLFQTLVLTSQRVDKLIEDPIVRAVTVTGSVAAGKAIAAKAGENLKKTVLELGGSDPYVVLADCAMQETVETCVKSRLINSGQSCIAAKRFIVVEEVRQEFEERFVARMKKEKLGDPLAPDTTVGPLARRDLRDELHDQVQASIDAGAKCLLGGRIPEGRGWFYPPTVLANVHPEMCVFMEETFGPVAAIIGARDEAEAIRLANQSVFGLGAAVFTQDRARGERIAAEQLEAGNCFVNELVKSDPRLPFGGVKDSGYGRELSVFGIREFVNVKTIWVK